VDRLSFIASGGIAAYFALLTALVGYRLLTGKIRTRGVLDGPNGRLSALRVQSLLFTALALGVFLAGLPAALASGRAALPELPGQLVWLFAASQLVYLAGKAARAFS